ncbi:MAG: hypothetical protein H3C43_02860 [Leptonema sp. (in: Bacteria)]|nr:hypothetical protein [Leptonema sp. (in: bacteria)]
MKHRPWVIVSITAWLVIGCRNPTSQFEFLNPLLVEGLSRPTTPTGLEASYNLAFRLLCLKWNQSVDPDTNFEVPIYHLYLYFHYPPAEFYRKEDIYEEVVGRQYCIKTDDFTGLLSFVVTGYDGWAESLVSAPMHFSIPQ